MRIPVAALLFIAALWPATALAERPTARIHRFQLKEARIDEAFRLLSELSGLNIVTTPAAGKQQVGTLLLRDVPVRGAIETICKVHGLWYRESNGVIRIMTAEEYQRDLKVVREPVTKVFSLLHPNPVAVATAIRDLFGERVRLSLGADEQELFGDRLGSRRDAPDARLFGGSGRTAFSDRSQLSGGVRNRSTNRNGDARRRDLAEEVTKEPLSSERLAQVETRGGRVVSDLRGLTQGRPVIAVTVNRRHNLIVVRTSDRDALQEIERLVNELDRPTPQVLLEMKILEVRLGDDFQSVIDVDYVAGPQQSNLPTGKQANPFVAGATTALEQLAGAGNFPVTGGALVYQFLNEHVRVRLQMLSRKNRLSVLATPLLLCANNEVSRIFIGEERPLVRNFELRTTTTDGVVTNQLVPTVDLRDIGNTLRMLPRINADRTVTLTIVQDISSVNRGGATLPVPSGSGGLASFQVDTVQTANLEGTVVAKDGLTLAVGGLLRKEWVDRREGIPYLMDIPLIGALFGETVRTEERRELILLVTPHVLMTPSEGKAVSEARMKALSLHPYHDSGDAALDHYDLDDVPGAQEYHLLVQDYLQPAPEPVR